MITCPKCGKELADGTKFCSKCGTPLGEAPKAEAPAAQEPVAEAPKAEAPAAQEPVAEAPKAEEPKAEAPKAEAPKAEAPKAEEPKEEEAEEGKKKNRWIKYAGIAAAVVVFLILVCSLFSGGNKGGKPYALYVKDKELMYSNSLKAKKSVQISTKLVKEGAASNDDFDRASLYCKFTEDGKYLFFRDKIESGDDGATIYYKDLTKLKKEAQKMDSSVKSYVINKSGSTVTYLKAGGDLWQFNVKKGEKDEKKVAKNVRAYYVSEEGNKIIYTVRNEEDRTTDLHLWTKKADEKLDGDIQSLYYVTDDFKTVYYVKNDSLYKKVGTKDKEKIDSDVSGVYGIYDSGEMYYAKSNDDGTANLYYFNGKEAKKIEEDIPDGSISAYYGSEKPILLYGVRESSSSKDMKYVIAVKDNLKELEQDDVRTASFSEDGKTIYYVAELNSEGKQGTVFKVSISGNKVGKVEQYDDDVYARLSLTDDGRLVYYKDAKNGKGELFCDKKQMDSDVMVGSVEYNKSAKAFVYYVDYSSSKEEGTLKICKAGGKAKPIADEVHDSILLPNGNVLYLKEYSTKSYEGTLCVYKGSKSVQIDDEVAGIIHVN